MVKLSQKTIVGVNVDRKSRRVIIVGAGFAGLNAAKALAGKSHVSVILIDQRNYHLFQPLLYQVATAGLNPADIAVPIRAQFTGVDNVEVHLGEVLEIDFVAQHISGPEGHLHYDFLILACGAQHSYFAHPEWEDFAPGLKTLEQAVEIRRRILSAFENAENELQPEEQQSLLTFVVVGGGPTGVELAGAIADISRTVLVRDFRRIDPSRARIILVEAGERLLAQFDPALSSKTVKDLQNLGVEVRLRTRVNGIDALGVQMDNERVAARTVFWAAGVQAAEMKMHPQAPLDRAGRVQVQADLSIPGFRNVYVVGDMASLELRPQVYLPGLAPAAIQTGRHAAQMILNSIAGRSTSSFRYVDKGLMATIGKHKAIVEAGRLRLTGYLAWLVWLFVHILYLIGFKSRLVVLIQWAWSYIFSKRGARLITSPQWKLKARTKG
jgi:NADH dehydrogenase